MEGIIVVFSGKIVFIYVDMLISQYELFQEKSKVIEVCVMEVEKM